MNYQWADVAWALAGTSRRISLTERDPVGRERARLCVPIFMELAERMREYEADPSDETADRIAALFDEVRVIAGPLWPESWRGVER